MATIATYLKNSTEGPGRMRARKVAFYSDSSQRFMGSLTIDGIDIYGDADLLQCLADELHELATMIDDANRPLEEL